ncbi:MAG: thiamine phosphate synthase [Candidatus Eremiobacteraeota bacterium]|nr:thiamine phosphate synthase [Candidatus Eremiobacteraeota bacterium]
MNTTSRTAVALRGLYAIVNEGERDPVSLTGAVLAGGIRLVQYRAKKGIVREHALAMRSLCRIAGALFLVNDDVEVALELDADGVHVGPDDSAWADLGALRAKLGTKLLGLSCASPAEARGAQSSGADYLGVGSCFATVSKPDAGEPIGIAGLRSVVASTSLPVAAIGGLNAGNLAQVFDAGATMAAVISALYVDDAATAARELVELWKAH